MHALDPVDGEYVFVKSPVTGEQLLVAIRKVDRVVLQDGSIQYVRKTTLIPAADGTLINPEQPAVVMCHVCLAHPLAVDATRHCSACLKTICLGCLGARSINPDGSAEHLCVQCSRKATWRACIQFYFSLRSLV